MAGDRKHPLWDERYPLSSKYDPDWVLENMMGPNVLWLTEWLARDLDLKPGMRVLDLGCGKALSSIFLAKEFGVQVWALDLWIGANENWQRIGEAGMGDSVYPLHVEAHDLPFAENFFDAVVSVDAYHYFGTDLMYLSYITSFLKAGGQIGVVVPTLMRELDGEVPEHFRRKQGDQPGWWQPGLCQSITTPAWWEQYWRQTELVDLERVDILEDGWRDWLFFEEMCEAAGKGFPPEADVLREDQGRYLGFSRLIARKKQSS